MSKKRTPQEKYNIVVEFFNTNISTAETCRKHNVSPATLQIWKEKFLQAGKQAFTNTGNTSKNHAKEIESLKRIIGEITIANDVLKKTLEGSKEMRIQAVHEMNKHMSLNKSAKYPGVSKRI